MARLTGDDLAAFVAASCARSGVEVKVTDALVVVRVTVLLTGTAGAAGGSRGAAVRSDSPHEVSSARLEASRSDGAGSDDDVVEDCFDDGCLASEVEVCPLSA